MYSICAISTLLWCRAGCKTQWVIRGPWLLLWMMVCRFWKYDSRSRHAGQSDYLLIIIFCYKEFENASTSQDSKPKCLQNSLIRTNRNTVAIFLWHLNICKILIWCSHMMSQVFRHLPHPRQKRKSIFLLPLLPFLGFEWWVCAEQLAYLC